MRIVHLKCPYITLQTNSEASEYFSQMAKFRLEAYLAHHTWGSLPLDEADYVADHILIEHENSIVGCFKAISQITCDFFRVRFPLLSTLSGPKNDVRFHDSAKEFLNDTRGRQNIGYMGRFSEMSKDRRARPAIRSMITESIYCIAAEYGWDAVLCTSQAASRKYIHNLGFKQFFDEDPAIFSDELRDLKTYAEIIDRDKISNRLNEMSAVNWNNRKLISESGIVEHIQAA